MLLKNCGLFKCIDEDGEQFFSQHNYHGREPWKDLQLKQIWIKVADTATFAHLNMNKGWGDLCKILGPITF